MCVCIYIYTYFFSLSLYIYIYIRALSIPLLATVSAPTSAEQRTWRLFASPATSWFGASRGLWPKRTPGSAVTWSPTVAQKAISLDSFGKESRHEELQMNYLMQCGSI